MAVEDDKNEPVDMEVEEKEVPHAPGTSLAALLYH
jgi:hypothetical protein